MIDVDYAGSPLVADYQGDANGSAQPHPGQRYPDWIRFAGTSHRLLVFGAVGDVESLTRLDGRWGNLVRISRDPEVSAGRAGVPKGGMVLIRPDGHIGFRAPSTGRGEIEALDRHWASYLV
jgi:hypothetical protein